MCLGLLYAKKDVPFSAGWLIFTCHGHCDYHSYKRAGFFIRNYYTPGQILPLKLTTPVNRAPDCPGPDCPGANLPGGQLSTSKKRTAGPRTVGPRRADNWVPGKTRVYFSGTPKLPQVFGTNIRIKSRMLNCTHISLNVPSPPQGPTGLKDNNRTW